MGEQCMTTNVWRIFSEAKGSVLFHNQGLDNIVAYYAKTKKMALTRVFVFSDGCRRQYKGRNNFVCVAQFLFNTNRDGLKVGVIKLIHKFAALHHFKGPHDAYGRDAKILCRTAERNQKARLASTFDVYQFCTTKLPHPRSRLTVSEIFCRRHPGPDSGPFVRCF